MRLLSGLGLFAFVATLSSGCMPSYQMSSTPAPGRSCPIDATQRADDSLSWYFPEASGDNRRLERWCETVEGPVVVAAPSASFGMLLPGDSLAVAVWNNNAGGGDLLRFLADEMGMRCSKDGSTLLAGGSHFVLLSQEAFRRSADLLEEPPQWAIPEAVSEGWLSGARPDAVEVARRCGLALAYVAAARNGGALRDGLGEDKGVAILSTLPLSDIVALELPYEAARRVALAATVRDRSGERLRVVSVHLISAAGPARVLTTGNGSRLRQALALIDALRQLDLALAGAGSDSASGYPVSTVLAGDLNTWSNRESTLRHLRDHFPESPPPPEEGTRGPFPTDHLFFRRAAGTDAPALIGGSYRRLENRYQSDHHPLVAWLRFSP
jgi:endonuclease/exonuclease/phosphatase family metal-dependent hydrolase